MQKRIAALLSLSAAIAGLFVPSAAPAQTFPTKPITVLVGLPPGGVIDWMGRTVAAELAKRWGQPVVVENKPGGGGAIAKAQTRQATPDGYTLLADTQIAVHSPLFLRDATWNPGKDIAPLTPVLFAPYVIITNTQVPAKSLREFIAHVKANPGKLNFAFVPNSGQQLDTLSFIKRTGIDIVPVSYQGGAPSLRALLANEAQVYFGAVFGLDAQVKAGKITPLAVTSAQRFPILPDVPTVKEAIGLDMDSTVQYGFYTTGGTPRPIIERLGKEIADIARGDMAPQIRKQGYEPLTMTPDEWTTAIIAEGRRGAEVARDANIRPQ
jgi:tripartite-type tricarboxylate transporter receptor subunit TctC